MSSEQKKYNYLHKFTAVDTSNIQNLRLGLVNEEIYDDQTIIIKEKLDKCQHLSQLDLIITRNETTDVGLSNLASVISRQVNLKHLLFQFEGNQYGEKSSCQLGQALGKLAHLEHLQLKVYYALFDGLGVGNLISHLGNCTKLTEFYLQLNGPENPQVAAELTKGIQQCQNLRNLSVCCLFYGFDEQTLPAFLSALLLLKHLNRLSLLLKFGDFGASILGSTILQHPTLIYFNLNFPSENLTQQGAENLGSSIAQARCKNLQLTIRLKDNRIGVLGAKSLATGLRRCQNLNYVALFLCNKDIGDEGYTSIKNGLRRSQSLVWYHIDVYYEDLC